MKDRRKLIQGQSENKASYFLTSYIFMGITTTREHSLHSLLYILSAATVFIDRWQHRSSF